MRPPPACTPNAIFFLVSQISRARVPSVIAGLPGGPFCVSSFVRQGLLRLLGAQHARLCSCFAGPGSPRRIECVASLAGGASLFASLTQHDGPDSSQSIPLCALTSASVRVFVAVPLSSLVPFSASRFHLPRRYVARDLGRRPAANLGAPLKAALLCSMCGTGWVCEGLPLLHYNFLSNCPFAGAFHSCHMKCAQADAPTLLPSCQKCFAGAFHFLTNSC